MIHGRKGVDLCLPFLLFPSAMKLLGGDLM